VRWPAVSAFVAFALYWLRGRAYLDWRHPHEDAFILFRYAENLAHGWGIVFNHGGPHTEGATDFLYMVALALAVRLGADVAIAAVWLNALGAALVAWVMAELALPARPRILDGLWAVLLGAFVPFVGGALASYDGFGTELYCGLVAFVFLLCLKANARAVIALPYLALTLGLFRPDGVIVGSAGVSVLAWFLRRDRPTVHEALPTVALRRLCIHGAVAFALGIAYFVWRSRYFGELLPLPLYVKSRGGPEVRGWGFVVPWFSDSTGPTPLLAAALVGTVLLRGRRRRRIKRAWAATLPAWILAWSLSFAYQSQNVDFRFEAPIYTLLVLLVVRLATQLRAETPNLLANAAVAAGTLAALWPAVQQGKKLWPLDYMDTFAVESAPLLEQARLVTTETGRMSYWHDATVLDLIGLNNAETARRPPTLASIARADPDLLMFHAAYTLDPEAASRVGDFAGGEIVQVRPESLLGAVREPFREYAQHDLERYGPEDLSVAIGPIVAIRYLAERAANFDVFFVRYGDDYNHVFGVRKASARAGSLENLITTSAALPYRSYAAAKKLGECDFCRFFAPSWRGS
jgi:hypothetical protein